MQPATWLLCWRICHHITWEMRESLLISFPSNPTWPDAEPHLPKGFLHMLQHGSCHGRGDCPCLPLEGQGHQASISPMFSTSTEKAPDHVTCLGPKCRHTCTRQCCPLLCLQAFTPCGCVPEPATSIAAQGSESASAKQQGAQKTNLAPAGTWTNCMRHVLNWKCTDNVLSTHAHFWKEITELTGNKDHSY